MELHMGEHAATTSDLRRLLASQWPQLAELPIEEAGHGTDNITIRIGDDFVARFPRLASAAPDLDKDATWLPVLSPHVPLHIPEVVFRGEPDDGFPLPWSVYRWIDGVEPTPATVKDWSKFGHALGDFVEALHAVLIPEAGCIPRSPRGAALSTLVDDGLQAIDEIGDSPSGEGLNLAAVESLWQDLAATPQPHEPDVWLHSDLRTGNLRVRGDYCRPRSPRSAVA